MIDVWEYSQIERRETIPACPDCHLAIGVSWIGLADRGARYECRNCALKFVARKVIS